MNRACNLVLIGAFLLTGFAFAKPPICEVLPEPSEELGTMPDKAYVTDYYALPIDAVNPRDRPL